MFEWYIQIPTYKALGSKDLLGLAGSKVPRSNMPNSTMQCLNMPDLGCMPDAVWEGEYTWGQSYKTFYTLGQI